MSLATVNGRVECEYDLPDDPEALLRVIVVEEHEGRSSPQRLASVFESVEKLYEVCAVVAGTRAEQLAVLRADSGQDKTFVLAGTPEVVRALKGLIVSAWDRVVFFRQLAVHERIEQVAETLPMLERIGRQERAGQIGQRPPQEDLRLDPQNLLGRRVDQPDAPQAITDDYAIADTLQDRHALAGLLLALLLVAVTLLTLALTLAGLATCGEYA